MSKSPKQLPISTLKDRNKCCFNSFIWCPLSGLCYTIIYITVSTFNSHIPGDCYLPTMVKTATIYIVESSVFNSNVFSLCACAKWTFFTKLLVSSINQDNKMLHATSC